MIPLPLAERNYDVFISHAHADNERFSDQLNAWCNSAKMVPWYDRDRLSNRVAPEIFEALRRSRAGIACVSKHSLESTWCQEEWRRFAEEKLALPDFGLVVFRLDGCAIPNDLAKYRWIDVSSQGFDGHCAESFIKELYAPANAENRWNHRPVYFGRGSKPVEVAAAKKITAVFASHRIRATRDASVETGVPLVTRVSSLLEGCHGASVLLTDRGGGKVSSFVLLEALVAINHGLNSLFVVEQSITDEILARELNSAMDVLVRGANPEPRAAEYEPLAVRLAEEVRNRGLSAFGRHTVRLDLQADATGLAAAIEDFADALPNAPQQVAQAFFGHSYNGNGVDGFMRARNALRAVAGIPCQSGDDFRMDLPGVEQQPRIVSSIASSLFGVFDITNRGDISSLNTCIEAGIALGAKIPMYLIAEGKARKSTPDPAFMLRNKKIEYYANEAELIAIMHQIGSRYRRVTE